MTNDELLARLTQQFLDFGSQEREPKFRDNISATNVGKCYRQTWYYMNSTKPDPDKVQTFERSKFTMQYGNLWEQYVCEILTGLKIPWSKEKVTDQKLRIIGFTDPIIQYEGKTIILECKATHESQYIHLYERALKQLNPDDYYSQLQTYLWLYPKADYGAFLIGNRNQRGNARAAPFFFQECQRDEKWKERNFNERIPLLIQHLDKGIPPEQEFPEESYECRYCVYHRRCWYGVK